MSKIPISILMTVTKNTVVSFNTESGSPQVRSTSE